MNWDIVLTLTGLMFLAYWWAYITGGPLSKKADDVDPGAILFGIPYRLAMRRLSRAAMLYQILENQAAEMELTKGQIDRKELARDHRLDLFLTGRKLFTWERALFCPVCLHWWLTILVGIVFTIFDLLGAREGIFLAGFVYLVNHFLIRKIS